MPEIPIENESKRIIQQMRRKLKNVTFRGMAGRVTDEGIEIGPPILPRAQKPVATEQTQVLVKIGAALGFGKYTGYIWDPPTDDVDPATTLSEADLGVTGAACLICNTREVGKSTNDLSYTGFLPLIVPGIISRVNSDGTPVVAVDVAQWKDC